MIYDLKITILFSMVSISFIFLFSKLKNTSYVLVTNCHIINYPPNLAA